MSNVTVSNKVSHFALGFDGDVAVDVYMINWRHEQIHNSLLAAIRVFMRYLTHTRSVFA